MKGIEVKREAQTETQKSSMNRYAPQLPITVGAETSQSQTRGSQSWSNMLVLGNQGLQSSPIACEGAYENTGEMLSWTLTGH